MKEPKRRADDNNDASVDVTVSDPPSQSPVSDDHIADDPVSKAFYPIIGQSCWNSKQGYGSFLTFEFGSPHLLVYDDRVRVLYIARKKKIRHSKRTISVHGDWHLWIYCCRWSIHLHDLRIAHSSSSSVQIARALDIIGGQKLTGFTVDEATCRSFFYFEFGGLLTTVPYDEDSEQWLLYEPQGTVVTFRADGTYSCAHGSTPDGHEEWHSLAGKPWAGTPSAGRTGDPAAAAIVMSQD